MSLILWDERERASVLSLVWSPWCDYPGRQAPSFHETAGWRGASAVSSLLFGVALTPFMAFVWAYDDQANWSEQTLVARVLGSKEKRRMLGLWVMQSEGTLPAYARTCCKFAVDMPEGLGPAIDSIDSAVRKQSYQAMGREIELLDDLVIHINHGKSSLTKQKHDRGLNFLVGILLSRAFNSLWRGREDAVLGYYPESLTLCRSVFEHWLAANWVCLHPNTTDRWLWDILDEVGRPTEFIPKVNDMLNEVDPSGLQASIYEMLSKFVHPRSTGLRWMIHFDEESTYFHVGGFFDRTRLRNCLYFLVLYAQACFRPTGQLVERMLGTLDQKWYDRAIDLSARAKAFTDSVEGEIIETAKQIELPPDATEA